MAKRLMDTAAPLAIADDLRTGISTLENLMVPRRLALYPGSLTPLAAFGTVTGMVFPILMFPAAFLFGLTELLIPELARCSAAGSKKRIRYLVGKSLRVALLYGCICGGILFLIAMPLCQTLYGSTEAGMLLQWFAPLAILLYCDAVTDAMIKGLGQQKASVRYNIITNILDISFLYILLPEYGVFGYFLSFLVTHMINYILSIRRLLKITDIRIPISLPLFSLLGTAGAVFAAQFLPDPTVRAFAFVLLSLCIMFLLGVWSKKDIHWIRGLIRKK
jgi:stage V sporulation protein B